MALGRLKLQRNESILVSVFLIAVTFVYVHYWLKPKKVALEQLKTDVEQAETQVVQNQATLATLESRAPASDELKTSKELLEQYMRANKKFSSVITGIVGSTRGDSFSLNEISTESETEVSGYVQTLYNVSAESSFIAIGKFLERLEDSSLLTEVASIEITKIANEMKRCKSKIKLFSYVSRKDAASASEMRITKEGASSEARSPASEAPTIENAVNAASKLMKNKENAK